MEVQSVFESRKMMIDDDGAGTTYIGTCDRNTFSKNLRLGLDPYAEDIWFIYKLVEVAPITERFVPANVDNTIIKTPLAWSNRAALTYI